MGRFLRRFFRYAFHAAAGFSALSFVACVLLWPLSYLRVMSLEYRTSGGSAYSLDGAGGRLWVYYQHDPSARPGLGCRFHPLPPGSGTGWSYADWKHEELPMLPGSRDQALGVLWLRGGGLFSLGIPFLYATLLSALLLALWLRGFIWRRRQAHRSGFPIEPAAPAR